MTVSTAPSYLGLDVTNSMELFNSSDIPTSDTIVNINVENWIFVAIRMVQALIALFGNTMTIIIITKHLKFSKNSHLLMFNLALDDILISLASPATLTMGLYLYLNNSPTEDWRQVCSVQGLYYICVVIANFIVNYITAIDRYISVMYPIKYRIHFTRKRLLIVMVCGWSLLALWITCILMFGRSNLENFRGGFCYAYTTVKPLLGDLLNVFFLLLYAAQVVLYVRIVLNLRKRDLQFQETKNTGITASNSASSVSGKVGRTLIIVVGTILASHLPNIIVSLVILTMKSTKGFNIIYTISWIVVLIFFMSTLINPIIYYIYIAEYKQAFHATLRRKQGTTVRQYRGSVSVM